MSSSFLGLGYTLGAFFPLGGGEGLFPLAFGLSWLFYALLSLPPFPFLSFLFFWSWLLESLRLLPLRSFALCFPFKSFSYCFKLSFPFNSFSSTFPPFPFCTFPFYTFYWFFPPLTSSFSADLLRCISLPGDLFPYNLPLFPGTYFYFAFGEAAPLLLPALSALSALSALLSAFPT